MANFLIPFDAGTEALYTFDADKLALVGGNVETKNLGIKGITFDGVDDGLQIADHDDFDHGAGDFAFAFLGIPANGTAQIVVGKDDTGTQRQFQIAVLADGKVQIAYWKAGSVVVLQASAASHFSAGVLTHALLQKRSGSFQVYINGSIVSLGTLTGTHGAMQATSADVFIGIGETGILPYDGWLSRIGMFGSSLSAAEAMAFYLDTIRLDVDDITFPGTPTSFYPMDDGAEGTSADGDVVRDLLNDNKHHADGNDGANNTGLTWDTDFLPVRYDANDPTIFKTAGDSGSVQGWTNFVETLGSGNQGSAAHQLSEDGIIWKNWNGSAWVIATTEFNTASTINSNISTFPIAAQKIFVKSFLISNGAQKVEIDLIQIGFSTNQAPVVDAGTNKVVNDNQSISPFSDSSFSDPDGTVDKAFYKVVGEVDIFTEIPQGGFGTLLEAVQAFQYQFNNPGTITVTLQVEDDLGATSEDSLTVTVSKYSTNWTVKDPEGNHLEHVSFDPGDGSGVQLVDSPFSFNFEFGESHVEISKPGWIKIEADIDIVGAGQSFLIVLEQFLAKNDIPDIAELVAERVNRITDVTMIVQADDEIIMTIEDDDSLDIIIEDDDEIIMIVESNKIAMVIEDDKEIIMIVEDN